jgi:hypothetical protein
MRLLGIDLVDFSWCDQASPIIDEKGAKLFLYFKIYFENSRRMLL